MSPKKTHVEAPIDLNQFLSIRRTFLPKISPDGKWILFVSNIGGKYNLWKVPAEGGWPHPLTNQEDLILEADWALNGKAVVFTSDFEGNENKQVFQISSDGGPAENLTARPEVQSFLLGASPDGRKIAYSDNRRKSDRFDTYVRDLRSGKEKIVLQRDTTGIDMPVDWSPDGRLLLVYRDDHNLNSNILLTTTASGPNVWTDLTPHEGDALYTHAKFSADGKWAFMVSNEGIDFKNVARVNLTARKPVLEWVLRAKHDVAGITLSPNGKTLVYCLNVRGSILPHFRNLQNGRETAIHFPKGIYSGIQFSRDGKSLVYLYQGPLQPADIWTMKLKDRRPVQVTFSMAGGIPAQRLVKPKEIRYLSFDGLPIHGLLYLPKGAKKNARLPAVLYPHGGPNAQNLNLFSMWFQYLLSRGYAILAPDFRGSTGYGTAFQKRIFRDWGGGDLEDLMHGVKFLKASGYVDPKRIGILGMSYGGFAVLRCITSHPKVFRAAVEAYGPANLFTFIASNPPSWAEGVYALVGHPERDREYLTERSPINHVDRIRTPLLVIQGKNDPRVAQAESEQIVESLRRRRRKVEYILFEDEGHGFTKMRNQIKALHSTADFFDRYL